MAEPKEELPRSLAPRAYSDLALVAKNRTKLRLIGDLARDHGHSVSVSAIIHKIAEQVSLSESTINRIVFAIYNIKSIQEKFDFSSEQIYRALSANIENNAPADWKKEHLKDWQRSEKEIIQILNELAEDHPLSISQKAERLTYAYQNILTDAEILTDVRPVFDKGGNNVLESIVGHTLLISYNDGTETSGLIPTFGTLDFVRR